MATSMTTGTAVDPKPPDPVTQTVEKVTFAAALSKPKLRPRFQPIPLPNRQYGLMEGQPKISFTSAELDAGAMAYQYSLIAKFTVGRPTSDTIRQAFQANWSIKGRATLSEIWDARQLLIILDSEEDMISAMTSPLRKIQHAMFRLFRYSTDYNPRQESPVTVKWLRLPGLPPPLFHRNYIGAIVNSFADFLDVDDRTKACGTMRYARACAEIDVNHPIPGKVWIDLPDGKGYWQEIILEGNLAYCSHCRIHGHELASCRKKKPAELGAQQGISKQRPVQHNTKQPVQEWTEVVRSKKSNTPSSRFGYGPDMLFKSTSESGGISQTGNPGEQLVVEAASPPVIPGGNDPATESPSLIQDPLTLEISSQQMHTVSTASMTSLPTNQSTKSQTIQAPIPKTVSSAEDPKATVIKDSSKAATLKVTTTPTLRGILKHPSSHQQSHPPASTSSKGPISDPPKPSQ